MIELIDIQTTALKNARRFVASEYLTDVPLTALTSEDSMIHPIMEAAWYMDGVKKLSIKENMLTVFAEETTDWSSIERMVRRLFTAYTPPKKESVENWEDLLSIQDQIKLKEIQSIMDLEIRPFLIKDNGDIKITGFSDTEIHLMYLGACRGCGFSKTSTLEMIKNKLAPSVPSHQIFVS